MQREADKALEPLIAASKQARVRCDTRTVLTGEPWRAILRTARSRGCDAIVMATHGRGALANLVLGTETGQVLAHSKVPVLVVR
jgi:nucleotide-binding universal stress UspA family protein